MSYYSATLIVPLISVLGDFEPEWSRRKKASGSCSTDMETKINIVGTSMTLESNPCSEDLLIDFFFFTSMAIRILCLMISGVVIILWI